MDIIVRGESQELDFVRRLCRDKVRRGLLAILPATSPACDDVVRLKNERDETVIQLREKMPAYRNLKNGCHYSPFPMPQSLPKMRQTTVKIPTLWMTRTSR